MAADLQSVHQYWKSFNLEDVQKKLDATATELASRQDESDTSRKKLVEQSREFKKNTPEDIRVRVAPLLKSFQSEIDALSKRSKAGEAAFLGVYKTLIDTPDPQHCLSHAVSVQKASHNASDLEVENQKLRETLKEYNQEFAEVKNQEVTIKQLKAELKESEKRLEYEAQLRAQSLEKDLQKTFAEKQHELEEAKSVLAQRLGETVQQIATLKQTLSSTQAELHEAKAQFEQSKTAKSDEMDILTSDLERSTERASLAEKENESLRSQLQDVITKLQSGAGHGRELDGEIDQLKKTNLTLEISAKEREVAHLVEEVQKQQAACSKVRIEGEARVSRLEEELTRTNHRAEQSKLKLDTQSDYEDIKKELGILKSIEFGEESTGDQSGKSLENLLLMKNRALLNDKTALKQANEELADCKSPPSPAPMVSRVPPPPPPPSSSEVATSSGPRADSVNSNSSANKDIKSPISSPSSSTPHDHLMSPPAPYASAASTWADSFKYCNSQADRSKDATLGALDTAEVASRVKEILSVHNIGQRLFAKQVLNLSQGTVSELLSKPKHWEKLTEKGRESYRKMFYWLSDQRNVQMLRSLAPRKSSGSFSTKQDSAQAEERIAMILRDAELEMERSQNKEQYGPVDPRAMRVKSEPRHPSTNGAKTSPAALVSGAMGVMGRPTGSVDTSGAQSSVDFSQAIVARIYEEELYKLAKQAKLSGNIANYTVYQEELNRHARQENAAAAAAAAVAASVAASASAAGKGREKSQGVLGEPNRYVSPPLQDQPQDLSMGGSSHHGGRNSSRPLIPPGFLSSSTTGFPGSAFTSPSAAAAAAAVAAANMAMNPLVPLSHHLAVLPHQARHHTKPSLSLEATPVSSITATTPIQPQPQLNNGHSIIDQMQSSVEYFINASQGHMLNQKPLKTVLPPITQEQFDRYSMVKTEDLVRQVKEVLSQYSISQRLFGECILGLSQGSVSDLLARPKPWQMLTQKGREPFIRMQMFVDDPGSVKKLMSNQYRFGADKLMRSTTSATTSPESSSHGGMGSGGSDPGSGDWQHSHPSMVPPSSMGGAAAAAAAAVCNQQALELAAVAAAAASGPSELDTLHLTSRVKEVLQFHNIGQKLFGEVVLGLSQGSVSDMLSKPKAWNNLSIKGREPFIKMRLWLSNPVEIERLKLFQNDLKAMKKRGGGVTEDSLSAAPSPSAAPSSERMSPYPLTSSSLNTKKSSSNRCSFSEEQKACLQEAFGTDPYPSPERMEQLAAQLSLSNKTVVNWFHNHRMRCKQQTRLTVSAGGSPSAPDVCTSSSYGSPGEEEASSRRAEEQEYGEEATGAKPQWTDTFEAGNLNQPSANVSTSNHSNHSNQSNHEDVAVTEERPSSSNSTTEADDLSGSQHLAPISSGRKRKAANPQYVLQGRDLERSDSVGQEGVGNDAEQTTDEKGENEGTSESGVDGDGCRKSKIARLEISVASADLDWEEVSREENINKLEKSVKQEATGEDWEF